MHFRREDGVWKQLEWSRNTGGEQGGTAPLTPCAKKNSLASYKGDLKRQLLPVEYMFQLFAFSVSDYNQSLVKALMLKMRFIFGSNRN